MNMWNLIGIGAWALLLIYLIIIIINIRHRHISMIVHGKRSGRTIAIDLLETLVFLLCAYGLFYVAALRPVDYTDPAQVSIKHEYAPLVLQTNSNQAYYVTVQSASSKSPVRHYTYWSDGTKVQVTSQNATVASDASVLPVDASGYPWSKKKLLELDKSSDQAFAATVKVTYKNTFINGLGVHAGHQADSFTIIRVPNKQLVNVKPLRSDK
ncbi:LVIS_2131 family protein [Lacticaseibacillus zhaodongensis]|uniref:LVIS_2131 family protein n=1 Tax=Lacticaseibacillus zhaodongensis TaxID=2668065 RepID=UPI0012D2B735|nr:LVIS_2131 family protein [Lacticaseibacillus zhaodongensis]